MNCIFIYNPNSGKSKILEKIEYIINALDKKFDKVDIYSTKCSKDMQKKASEVCEKYDVIVFAGGDGSFNEILQGIAGHKKKPKLGYIPCGTVNDIARALNIPRNIKKALKNILNGQSEFFDVMKINDNYAMYVCCAGAFTSSSYLAPQIEKRVLGRVAYGIQGIKNNMQFQNFEVGLKCLDNEIVLDTVFVLIMNGKSVAGFKINKDASMQDGKLELLIVKQPKNPTLLQKIKSFFKVLKVFIVRYSKLKEKQITRFEGNHFEIETKQNVVWNFDGERGVTGNITVDVIPTFIEIIVPKN